MTSRQVRLSVNEAPIETDYFVQRFIDHTIGGIIASLEGTGEIKHVDIAIEGDKVTITLNDATVPLNHFTIKIIRNTIIGMVSSLKGVDDTGRLNISIKRTA